MVSRRICSGCGHPLADEAAEMLCPVCALLGIVEPSTDDPVPELEEETGRCMVFGPYELVEEIASGGMGVVYKARQRGLNRVVALKMVLGGPLASASARKRFLAEAQAAAGLQHPNIIAIHEVGEHDGQPFFSMDYVEGRSLAALLRDGPLPPRRAAAYLQTIAEAVHYAHQKGILHRDLKPSNVLIDESDQPKITDFGLAKRLMGDSDLTVSGEVLGSPNYMAPEQAQGRHREVGPASDVYSLGALLYHLLTGRPPFQAATITEVLRQVTTSEPAPPGMLNPSIPSDLQTICLKCLDKEISRRYPTAQALAEDLARLLRCDPILARPLGPAGRLWKWCRRNPHLAGAVGVAILSISAALIGVAVQWRRAEVHRMRAEAEASLSLRQAYAADMKEVSRALEESDTGRALELLDRYRPGPNSQADLRGWEWRYLWSRCRPEALFTLCQYSNAVSALAFSPDRNELVVRREDGTLAFWDISSRKCRQSKEVAARGLAAMTLTCSTRTGLLAWGCSDAQDKAVVCFENAGGQSPTAPLPHPDPLRSLALSPDGRSLATMAVDGTVRVWDLGSRQVITHFDWSQPPPPAPGKPQPHSAVGPWSQLYGRVLFSPDGELLAIGEIGPRIRLWETAAGREREPLSLASLGDGVTALAFSPDGRFLAATCGVADNEVHVWDLVSRTALHFKGHTGWIAVLAFSPDGKTLASAGADQTLRLWDVAQQSGPRRFQGGTDEICALAWSRDGKTLVSGGKDGCVRYWDPAANSSSAYRRLPELVKSQGIDFSPDSQELVTVTQADGSLLRWKLENLQPIPGLSFLGSNHTVLDLSPKGDLLALGGAGGDTQVWDLGVRQVVTNLSLHVCGVSQVAFSSKGNLLACGGAVSNGLYGRMWAVAGWREVSLESMRVQGGTSGTFSPDERMFALGYRDGTAAWWDLKTGRRLAVFDTRNAVSVWVAFSPDGRLFLTWGMEDGRLTLWDTFSREPRYMGRVSRNGLQNGVFSPDGRRFAVWATGPNSRIKLWDAQTGRELLSLPSEVNFANRLAFSPDGNWLLAASIEGIALLWHAPSLEEIARVENLEASGNGKRLAGQRRNREL